MFFEAFFTTKPVGQGTGLGLFVSRALIETMGGDISISRAPGQGTIVRVSPALGSG